MRPDVIIHIGPPKTGTTSLQVAFDEVKHPDFFYAGTFQPRHRNTGSLSQTLYSACSIKSRNQINVSELRGQMYRLTKNGKSIIFSEEMFLLERGQVSIEEKILNLSKILSGFHCRIVISARPGKFALPSLYQEIFNSLPWKLQKNFEAFCRDRSFVCYDYVAVCDMLNKSGFDDIVLVDFTSLTKQTLNIGALTACDDFNECDVAVQRHNAGLSSGGGKERVLPKVSLKSLGGLTLSKLLIKALCLRKWPGYRVFVNVLEGIEVLPSDNRNLRVPPDVAFRLDVAYQEALHRYSRTTVKNKVDSS